jgi:hypothetical protein
LAQGVVVGLSWFTARAVAEVEVLVAVPVSMIWLCLLVKCVISIMGVQDKVVVVQETSTDVLGAIQDSSFMAVMAMLI